MKRIAFVLALIAPAAALAERSPEAMPDTAFLAEFRLGAAAPVSIGSLAIGSGITAVPSLTVGARLIGRLHLGIGFEFYRLSNAGGVLGGATDTNVVTFAPTIAADLVKSSDGRVAFYLKAGLPMGPVITCPNGARCDDNFSIGFDLALGGRYALHHMFALGLEAGAEGVFIGPQRNNTQGVVAFYGALVGSFFYGK